MPTPVGAEANLAAAQRYVASQRALQISGLAWHNWGEKSLLQRYSSLRETGSQVVLLAANDDDAAGAGPAGGRAAGSPAPSFDLPPGHHGRQFAALAGPALQTVDLSVLQTFSFFKAEARARDGFLRTARSVAGLTSVEQLEAPTGTAHAYDMLHLLALAIRRAGSTDRSAVRDALERLPPYRGLVKHYRPAFTPERHEALGPEELLMARYRADGVLVPFSL